MANCHHVISWKRANPTVTLAAVMLLGGLIVLGTISLDVGTWIESTSTCSSGRVIADPAGNPGLVKDCEVLLSVMDVLSGDVRLNWSPDSPMAYWKGVVAGGDPPRVYDLSLTGRDNDVVLPLTGEIPTELARLSGLKVLSLRENRLTGEIPPELGNLTRLKSLDISFNRLTGAIPAELGGLSSLEDMRLEGNELTGEIPEDLGDLTELRWLGLGHNELTGEIPASLGRLSNLTYLFMRDNELTGSIPPELGYLPSLRVLTLRENKFTGCTPAALISVSDNDLPNTGLPLCNLSEESSGSNSTGSRFDSAPHQAVQQRPFS